MYIRAIMLEQWESIYEKLSELQYDFIVKNNKGRNDFRYNTEYLQNEKEKVQLVSEAVGLIRSHKELNDMLIEDDLKLKDENDQPLFDPNALKEYYDGGEMYNQSHFLKYSSRLLSKIETKIDFLSKED